MQVRLIAKNLVIMFDKASGVHTPTHTSGSPGTQFKLNNEKLSDIIHNVRKHFRAGNHFYLRF